jgi:hypothetical protein
MYYNTNNGGQIVWLRRGFRIMMDKSSYIYNYTCQSSKSIPLCLCFCIDCLFWYACSWYNFWRWHEVICHRAWSFICSMRLGKRWQSVFLILMELSTITAYTFFYHNRHTHSKLIMKQQKLFFILMSLIVFLYL